MQKTQQNFLNKTASFKMFNLRSPVWELKTAYTLSSKNIVSQKLRGTYDICDWYSNICPCNNASRHRLRFQKQCKNNILSFPSILVATWPWGIKTRSNAAELWLCKCALSSAPFSKQPKAHECYKNPKVPGKYAAHRAYGWLPFPLMIFPA